MAVAFRSSTSAGVNTGSGSWTITVPSGVVDGDILVLAAQSGNFDSFSITGWTMIEGSGSHGSYLLYRIAASEPASYTLNWNLFAENGSWMCVAYSGVKNAAPDGHSQNENAGGGHPATPYTATSISPSGSTDTLVTIFTLMNDASGLSFADPTTSETKRALLVTNVAGVNANTIIACDETLSSSGATGTRGNGWASNPAGGHVCTGFMFALQPAPPVANFIITD